MNEISDAQSKTEKANERQRGSTRSMVRSCAVQSTKVLVWTNG